LNYLNPSQQRGFFISYILTPYLKIPLQREKKFLENFGGICIFVKKENYEKEKENYEYVSI
jgi:hypothetical protein